MSTCTRSIPIAATAEITQSGMSSIAKRLPAAWMSASGAAEVRSGECAASSTAIRQGMDTAPKVAAKRNRQPDPGGEVESRIGEIVAGLVPDGATLQMGIGAIPDAVLARLHNKHDLGVHTEMFSDGMVDLVRSGAVTNKLKQVKPGRLVTSFVFGTKRLFDFVDDNPLVEFHPSDRTNDTSVIRRNNNTVAINSALQIDLSGQVCADSLGHRIYSGIGGQMDFMRGAALSKGGKPILALPSTAKGGRWRRSASER